MAPLEPRSPGALILFIPNPTWESPLQKVYPRLDAGSCETTLPGKLHARSDDGWEVTLVDLHASPYCEGAALEGSFAACLIPEPF